MEIVALIVALFASLTALVLSIVKEPDAEDVIKFVQNSCDIEILEAFEKLFRMRRLLILSSIWEDQKRLG